ncbi:ADP-ribosylglycohydrolase family protein [Sutterella sp.]|uniref:ADP-ribosylglycohydrolase family protein n=1 Tax=Sutterella sp. TaxID=1981025 RepID=UPI0026DF1463|nr:ADP-ribosylglycohydrolase family protein [Sutterella sp.]MDO5531332.1 ADP-ribosylglycohydrolase family protein [Sutterella sp.]
MSLLGAVIGDTLGSVYEFANFRGSPDELKFFPADATPTDDSILTCAVADALLDSRTQDGSVMADWFSSVITGKLRDWALTDWKGKARSGFGGRFLRWAMTPDAPAYGSLGNGSAMRCSACAWAAESLEEALDLAERSALPTHNHPEGILGAQATVWAIRRFMDLGRGTTSKASIAAEWEILWPGLEALPHLGALEPPIPFDVTCRGTVPLAVAIALASNSYEETVRRAVATGGDCDTIAAIAGSVAEAAWGVPDELRVNILARLPDRMKSVILAFEAAFPGRRPRHN